MNAHDELEVSSEYSGCDFEDWVAAAKKYAEKNLDLWPFQVEAMASDFAWNWEGCEITEEMLQKAYEDWTSGSNPYCTSHSIELEGYDEIGQYNHDSRIAQREIIELAIAMGIDLQIAQRISEDIYKSKGNSIGIYNDVEDHLSSIQEWIDGVNELSPHHVPFDKLNLLERQEREEDLRLERLSKTEGVWRKA